MTKKDVVVNWRKRGIGAILAIISALWLASATARQLMSLGITLMAIGCVFYVSFKAFMALKAWYNHPKNKGIRKAVDNQTQQLTQMIKEGN